MESVSSRIDISVGVAEAEARGISVCVAVGTMGVIVGGMGVGVVKTSTEKLQASSDNALNRKRITGKNLLCFLIAFSLADTNMKFTVGIISSE
jgi:hypothetical protein